VRFLEQEPCASQAYPMNAGQLIARARPGSPVVRRVMRVSAVPPIQLREVPTAVFDSIPTTPVVLRAGEPLLDEAQLAAAGTSAAGLARRLPAARRVRQLAAAGVIVWAAISLIAFFRARRDSGRFNFQDSPGRKPSPEAALSVYGEIVVLAACVELLAHVVVARCSALTRSARRIRRAGHRSTPAPGAEPRWAVIGDRLGS
jgi:hypothetical protein